MWRFTLNNLGKLILTTIICFITIILTLTFINVQELNLDKVDSNQKLHSNSANIEYVFPATTATQPPVLVPTPDTTPVKMESIEYFTIYFGPGSSNVTIESQIEVERLIEFVDLHQVINVELRGNVANVGVYDPEFDVELSLNRANAIKERLVVHGISEDIITVYSNGVSEQIPAVDGLDEIQTNRRVDVILTFM